MLKPRDLLHTSAAPWRSSTALQTRPILPCRRFRVVPATQYVQHFASDRRHMLVDAPSISTEGRRGAWIAPPPPWPPIKAPAGQTNTLPLFLNMAILSESGGDAPHGTVLSQEAFVRVFGDAGNTVEGK